MYEDLKVASSRFLVGAVEKKRTKQCLHSTKQTFNVVVWIAFSAL